MQAKGFACDLFISPRRYYILDMQKIILANRVFASIIWRDSTLFFNQRGSGKVFRFTDEPVHIVIAVKHVKHGI